MSGSRLGGIFWALTASYGKAYVSVSESQIPKDDAQLSGFRAKVDALWGCNIDRDKPYQESSVSAAEESNERDGAYPYTQAVGQSNFIVGQGASMLSADLCSKADVHGMRCTAAIDSF